MIKQIRPSLVDLYVNEDVHQTMPHGTDPGKYDVLPYIINRIANRFNMYREEEEKAKKITMSKEQLDDHYYQLLQENVLALRR